MRRKLIWVLAGLLVGSGVAAATLVNASGNKGTNIQQQETDDAHENQGAEVDDADEPGDNDGAGDIEEQGGSGEDQGSTEAEDADEAGDHDGPGEVEDGD